MDLDDAIDLHVHTAPDIYERSVSDAQLVREAAAAGMHAVLLKSHHTLTADRAALAFEEAGPHVFGGLALNLPVGGLNPVAVETAIAFGAKQIWMPTLHAAHCLRVAEPEMFRVEARKGRHGISILDDSGELVKEVWPILEQVRDADIALGTGHLAPEESLVLLREASALGINRLLVTHPLMSFTRFTLDQMRQAVSYGAVLEFDRLSCSPNWHDPVDPRRTAEAIRTLGPKHCVLATDGGQPYNPHPAVMLDEFARALYDHDLTLPELRTMMCENPARIMGLR